MTYRTKRLIEVEGVAGVAVAGETAGAAGSRGAGAGDLTNPAKCDIDLRIVSHTNEITETIATVDP